MYQSYSTGKIVREIIEELTARGVTHMGKPVKANTIYKILRLEKYIGIYRHGDEVFTNILTKEIRRDFCLPAGKILSATYRHIIYSADFGT